LAISFTGSALDGATLGSVHNFGHSLLREIGCGHESEIGAASGGKLTAARGEKYFIVGEMYT
jgi:hypothetical protein